MDKTRNLFTKLTSHLHLNVFWAYHYYCLIVLLFVVKGVQMYEELGKVLNEQLPSPETLSTPGQLIN